MMAPSGDRLVSLAVWSVMATEGVMFAALLAMHGGQRLAPPTAAVAIAATVAIALFVGAGSLASALRRTRDRQPQAAARLLVVVSALGLAALALELATARLFGGTDPLAVAIVGLHAAHVAAASALAMWVLVLVRCGRVHHRHLRVLELVVSYWYFVALVWVFVWPMFVAGRP